MHDSRLARFTAAVLVAASMGTASSAPIAAQGGLDLSPWKGRVVLVDFWASWCGPCRRSFPWMQEMLERYRDDGLTVVAVNLDTDRADAERFLAQGRFEFEHVYDPDGWIADHYRIAAMPSSLVFDRKGRLLYRHTGFNPSDADLYEDHLVRALEGTAEPEDHPEAGPALAAVRPWQKGALARADMRLDADPLDVGFDEHIYFSKEGSAGGRGFGSGGCGCN